MNGILITGGRGYLGQAIYRRLRLTSKEVLRVGRSPANDVRCDLLDSDAVLQLIKDHPASSIIHCAAEVPRRPEDYRSDEAAERSVAMTRHLAQAQPPRLVFTSSMVVYPDDIDTASEEDALSSASGYAGSKIAGEQLLLARSEIMAVILRLPGLFGGSRRSGLIYNAALRFARGERPELTFPPPLWAGMHVEDAAEICIRAALADIKSSTILNVGYPERMSTNNAVARLAALFDATWPELAGRGFAFDLSRMEAVLGLPTGNYSARLAEVAEEARRDATEGKC